MNLIEHLKEQREFSCKTFGPGVRTDGLIDHIKKELEEIKKTPLDLEEWIDLVMLALDGAWRAGFEPEEIAEQLKAKLEKNKNRDWPDWRKAEPGKAIEHTREELYYLHDKTRGYVGNSMVWWKFDNCGYVCDVRQARVWTKEEAQEYCERAGDLEMWPKQYIDEHVQFHVDMQSVDRKHLSVIA